MCLNHLMNPAGVKRKKKKRKVRRESLGLFQKVIKVPAELLRWDRRESRYIRGLSLWKDSVCVYMFVCARKRKRQMCVCVGVSVCVCLVLKRRL